MSHVRAAVGGLGIGAAVGMMPALSQPKRDKDGITGSEAVHLIPAVVLGGSLGMIGELAFAVRPTTATRGGLLGAGIMAGAVLGYSLLD